MPTEHMASFFLGDPTLLMKYFIMTKFFKTLKPTN